jgi:hypothetical protein
VLWFRVPTRCRSVCTGPKGFGSGRQVNISTLIQTVEAARLMGATAILAGVSPGIAQTMVTLDIDLGRMITVGDLQSGIERAEQLLGYTVTRARTRASLN